MATTNIRGAADAAASIEYVTLGRGEKRRTNLQNGTTRDAYRICDMQDDEFVAYAQQMAQANSRKWQLYELRVSFDEELDPNNPEDCKRCAEVSYEIAERLYPGCPKNVYVHTDGVGGKCHAHAEVVNHDPVTGYAIRGNTSHRHVAVEADAVCKKHGLSAMGSVEETWRETMKLSELTPFEQELGKKIHACLQRSTSSTEFKQLLEAEDVELRETKRVVKEADVETTVYGWSYSMLDRTGSKSRRRRRKASSLSGEFTRESVMLRFGELDGETAAAARLKAKDRARARWLKQSKANELPDERLIGDSERVQVDAIETAANFAELTNHCRFKKDNREFYKELATRLGKNGKEAFERDMRRMDIELDRAKHLFKNDAEMRAQLQSRPENVVYKAAERAAKRDDSAVAVALLLMLACTMTMQKSFFKGVADRRLSRSRRKMWDIENRRHVAQVVAEKFTDIEDDAPDIRVSSKVSNGRVPIIRRTPRQATRPERHPQRKAMRSL